MGYVLFRGMEKKSMKKKLIRVTTVPISLKILLEGQLRFMNNYFEVIGVSSDGNVDKLKEKMKFYLYQNIDKETMKIKNLKRIEDFNIEKIMKKFKDVVGENNE